MNVPHPEMLRQGVPNMHQSLMPQQLFPQQSQHGQQPSQHNLGLLQNNQGANPGLGIIAGQPGPSTPNYPMNMQPVNPQRRPVFMSAQPNGSGLHPGGAGGPPHMAGLAPNQMQGMQSMGGNMSGNMGGFPGAGMIPQQTIRRVQSQQAVGQAGAHMGGMQPGMMGGMPGMPGPPQMSGLRMAPSMQMRQQQQQPQQHGQGGGAMSPEMGLTMRPGPMAGASQLQPHIRTSSGSQMMPALTQQANLGQGHGMQHNFGTPVSLSHQHQPSQMGSSMHAHVGPSGQQPASMGPQPGGNRAQMVTPDNMYMNFQNAPIQPQLSHGVPRIMENMSNPQFNMAPSPSPMNAGGDMSQRGNGPMNASGPMTPAQVLNMNAGGDSFPANPYGMGQPISAPPRPPSHNGPRNGFPMASSQSQPSLAPQRSPRQPDHLSNPMHPGAGPMQRPQSQPQVAHRSSPIPHPGPVRTPRGSQPSLPMNTSGMLPPTRVPTAAGQSPQGPSHPPAQLPTSAPPSAHPAQIAPRPPSVTPTAPSVPTRSTSTAPSAGQQSAAAESSQPPRASAPPSAQTPGPSAPAPSVQPAPTQIPRSPMYPIGLGQGISRLLQLSYQLGVENKDRLNMSYWTNFVATYFTEKSTIKLTLWKDNQQVEAKPFEISYPIFPRFFLVTSQSGVKTQSLVLNGARERCIGPMHGLVECPAAQWIFRYTNGYNITLSGPLTAEIVVLPMPITQSSSQPQLQQFVLKLEKLVFDAMTHDKYLAVDAIQGIRIPDSPQGTAMSPGAIGNSNGTVDDPNKYEEPRHIYESVVIPAEPINAFGIPQATMRCLELAESVTQMSDLIQFSINKKMGPCDALKSLAQKLRDEHRGNYNGNFLIPVHPTYSEVPNGAGAVPSGPSTSFGNMGIMPGPSQPPPSSEQPSTNQPDGGPKSAKAAPPQSAQASGSTPSASTPASAPTPAGAPTTPSIANASLKRKQPPSQRTGEDSPTTANTSTDQQQPAKRANRKRGRTQGS